MIYFAVGFLMGVLAGLVLHIKLSTRMFRRFEYLSATKLKTGSLPASDFFDLWYHAIECVFYFRLPRDNE